MIAGVFSPLSNLKKKIIFLWRGAPSSPAHHPVPSPARSMTNSGQHFARRRRRSFSLGVEHATIQFFPFLAAFHAVHAMGSMLVNDNAAEKLLFVREDADVG